MTVALAVVELGSLFAMCTLMSFFTVPGPFLWSRMTPILGEAFVLTLLCLATFYYNGLYDLRLVRSLSEFIRRLVKSLALAFLLLTVLFRIVPEASASGNTRLLLAFPAAGLLLGLRALGYKLVRGRYLDRRLLFLGENALAERIVTEIRKSPHLGYSVAGFIDSTNGSGADLKHAPVGTLDTLERTVTEVRPHTIVVALAERRGRLPIAQLLNSFVNGVRVEDAVEVYERITRKMAIEALSAGDVLFRKDFRKSAFQLTLIRGLSVVGAFLGLAVLAPLLLLVAAAIRLDSPGPVLFFQRRLGARGKPFDLVKFRTMRPCARRPSEWEKDNEYRITRVGAWLRKSRVDELPQLWNVLRGDMNLVGPRPHPVTNQKLFADNIHYYAIRSLIRPGITGWAQVRYGYANNLDEETEKMRYDLYYIKHMSVWFDLRIIADTFKLVLFGRECDTAEGSHWGSEKRWVGESFGSLWK